MRPFVLLVALVALTRASAMYAQGNPADSLYRVARRALSDKDYSTAANAFDAIATRYPRSSYASDALY